ncbi:unnamed protein product [Orchesella dallaii]|uniref:G-protein coupled receptors family 2 profile 2 domain-containing protein n=1 Tax=Orchesella dallaii TaxID=48710 RepID=A0ABP1RLJ4_9HEXA
MRIDATSGVVTLQRLSDERVWKPYDNPFCVDRIKDIPTTTTGHVRTLRQVVLLCPNPAHSEDESHHSIDEITTVLAHVVASIFLLLIVAIYVTILDRQNFYGLLILSYTMSLLFTYILIAAAHIISMLENPEQKGFSPIGSHYLLFVTYMWLTVMNFNLLLAVKSLQPVNSNSKRIKTFVFYSVMAWGIPVLVVSIFVAIDEIYR